MAKLWENPADVERFNNLWPWLCSEGTTWAAAYAAVPYIVELARRLTPEKRFDYLCFVGLTVICSCPGQGESFEIKPFLEEGYRRAIADALPLLAESLVYQHDATETRYLLAAVAALKGHPQLGGILEHLDSISGQCPICGEWVYPEEIQEAGC
ncbi:MAG TPA: hypothetical protein VF590_06200 [Isosphaeraceae bacterium]